MSPSKTFKATLQRGGAPYNWTIIHIPFDAAKLWGKRGNLRVNGEVNGVNFNAALFPNGRGGHYMLVNKKLQTAAKISTGETVTFLLKPDEKKKVVTMPAELQAILRKERPMQRWFASLSLSTQNWINHHVGEVKQEEARKRRADQIAERILETMEAEMELPPALQLAFRHNPGARDGWDLMTPRQRRGELFGIFSYRTPDARSRRIAKMLDIASALAEKRKKS
jgi:uncharacterized protein YdeI (YjbR/CyaY-like superfamily)